MSDNPISKKVIAISLLVVCFVWFGVGVLPAVLSWWTEGISLADAGTVGDSFGLVNSLFSALALAVLILTIMLQYNELALQREDLQDTKRQVERQAEAQELSERRLFLSAYVGLSEAMRALADQEAQEGAYVLRGRAIRDDLFNKLVVLTSELDQQAQEMFPSVASTMEHRKQFLQVRLSVAHMIKVCEEHRFSLRSDEDYERLMEQLQELLGQTINLPEFLVKKGAVSRLSNAIQMLDSAPSKVGSEKEVNAVRDELLAAFEMLRTPLADKSFL